MSLRKVVTEIVWNGVQKTAFGSTVAVCVSATCHAGVQVHALATTKANQLYEQTTHELATSWGYEKPIIPYVQSKKSIFELVEFYAVAEGISVDLVLSTMTQESRGKTHAVSPKGATGLMQIMPDTGKRFCGITDKKELLDPENNIRCGVKVLKDALVRADWDLQKALQIYNYGKTCTIGVDCPEETVEHGRLIMSRLGQDKRKWNKIKG